MKTTWLQDLRQDLRFALRSLAKHKSFAAMSIASLAIGIGANTALFSVVNGLVLQPLPFPEPDRLVRLHGTSPLTPQGGTLANILVYRSESTSFEAIAGCEVTARYLRSESGPERVMSVQVEMDFFLMLGSAPLKGRTFAAGDPTNLAVVSEAFWKRRLRGEPSAVGNALILDDQAYTIAGIMPDSFQFPYRAGSLLSSVASEARTDLWIPFGQPLGPRSRLGHVFGRLKPGVSLSAAQSELSVIAKRLETQYPDTNTGRGIRIEPLTDDVVAKSVRRPLFLLFGAVVLVLALACANVANLSLVRMTLRSREVAIRAALGAGRSRLVRQFLTEGLLLSLAGGAAGLALAWWSTNRLLLAAGARIPRAHEVGIDWRVFLFLLAVCTLTGVALGLAPAIISARKDVQSVLQESGARSTMATGQRRLRDGLVVAEVALAFILAVGATLLIRELVRLRNTNMGMVTNNVVTFHLGHRRTAKTDTRQFYEIADRVTQLPGVRAAGFIQLLPLQSWGWTSNSSEFRLVGTAPLPQVFPIELRYVTPGYFQALGITIQKGRGFTAQDSAGVPIAIMINEALARRCFGNEDPVGKQTTRGTIIGIVGDVRQVNLDRPAAPEIYYNIAQNWSQLSDLGMTLVVSARDRPERLIQAIRSVVREVNPNQAIFGVKTMERVVADSLSDFTLYLWLMASFAGLALLLATTGTYGVISYVATSRSREFAICLALGADRGKVTRMVLSQGLRLTAIGLGLGLCGALAAAPQLQDLPVTVRPPDAATTAPIALLIAAVAIVASFIPARRASAVNPISVLRDE